MTTFEKIRSHAIPTLDAVAEEYVEQATGAVHYHLTTESPELVFLVAFPTVPDTSDGRAHILEHLALCGSERYPVRDPFFAMMRRSTATFMNAFTYADRTVYPFASTDRNDFFNLLDVYLDATFFPRLDYLNFLQEGWRHVIEDGKLAYQGVVFNEMKGAFSDPMRALHQGVTATQLQGTTYANEYGGDPLAIPQLTHQMLLDFHASHYHPSQAVFMTAGAVSAADVQQRIAANVLDKLTGKAPRLLPQLATPATAQRETIVKVPSQTANDDEYGLQQSWLLGEAADLTAYYEAEMLTAGLVGSAAAPVQLAMESAGYGRPSQLNGFDPGARQMLFFIGMEGLTMAQLPAARARIEAALEQAATEGVPPALLQAALRDLKYRQRDTSGGRMPNMLTRLLNALPVAMRGGDVFTAIDSGAALRQLEQRIADPAYFKGLVRKLIDSPARVVTTVVPDPAYFAARDATEAAMLQAAQARLTNAEWARILDDTKALDAHQDQVSDFSMLPRIKPGDVSQRPAALPVIPVPRENKYAFPIASNQISYAVMEFDVSALPAQSWQWLVLYTDLRGALGLGDMDYLEAGTWRESRVASFWLSTDATLDRAGQLRVCLRLHASGLSEDQGGISQVLAAYLAEPRFDEADRIAFLVESNYQHHVNNLAQDGSRYAAISAGAPLSALGDYQDRTAGVALLPFLGMLMQSVGTAEGRTMISEKLHALHQSIIASPVVLLAGGVGDDAPQLAASINMPSAAGHATAVAHGDAASPAGLSNEALHAVSQVNHCNIAWQVPAIGSDHAPAFAVAAELISQQLLHQSIREKGGAYGSNARYDGDAGVFSMTSYRDPRLAATYADFSRAVAQVATQAFTAEQLEEAIVSVIKGLDKPKSPFDAVLHAWQLHQRGIDTDLRMRFRTGVLSCDLAAVKEVVATYLVPERASRAAFVGDLDQDLAGLLPVALHDLIGEA